jgi:hypothetical protein
MVIASPIGASVAFRAGSVGHSGTHTSRLESSNVRQYHRHIDKIWLLLTNDS